MSLNGLSVLVTGAAQGVGRGIALAAAAEGAAVAVTARRIEAAQAVADEIAARGGRATALTCDVGDRASVEAAIAGTVAAFGKLDGLVHNAVSGFSSVPVAIEDVPEDNWDDQMRVSFRGTLHCAQAAFPALRASGGTLVVLTSNAGIEGNPSIGPYSAMKGAQRGFIKSLAREWGPLGIRVNGIAPVALTPAMDKFFELHPHMVPVISNRAALGRIGDCESDIGAGVAFLLGPQSRFVSGQTLILTGGAYML
ncbi:SDR family oxidoreductase [Sphingomonas histidinilytica]|uniref:3-oxoacyl-[acyl-carrier protein] reductase n=2 Tax=Rhizorhabdus histidinilytica TaxID=439228 RepID=A0A1T5G1F4_9SPHN|nr:SDR family NAD(P)-dependent oxidoreductase [Rhizorhabdus histidinilytica]MBO9378413.1 SDR family oxidoreductase [Rhizorhabdus histidinilytica]SKC02104.1 3-oxoacyl-[acyl-carrier protein] reductase [Rhizorhabdus histidinilytica]